MPSKPMLAKDVSLEELSNLRYPLLAQPKLDGIRATLWDGAFYSRSLKKIPNRELQVLAKMLPSELNGLDGEFIIGEPFLDPFLKTVSATMSETSPQDGLARFFVFDVISNLSFVSRHAICKDIMMPLLPSERFKLVQNVWVADAEAVKLAYLKYLDMGYEGMILREPAGLYKNGRSTLREQFLLKLKPYRDAEAIVIGFEPLQHNSNEAFTNELGRTARSTAKSGQVTLPMLGSLLVRDRISGIEFSIGTGFTEAERLAIWRHKETYLKCTLTYQYLESGMKTKPRHPSFLRWRTPE